MQFSSLFETIGRYIVLREHDRELLKDYFIYREVPRGYTLIQYGEIVKEWYFLESGCVRFYYIKQNGEEATGFFFTENMFFTSFESFLSGKPGNQVFETLEPCSLLVMRREKMDELYKRIPVMETFVRKLLEERFIQAQQVVASYILLNPEERYLRMLQSNPAILNRVPQRTLASYLGITPVSLSRIRKRIFEKPDEESPKT